MNFGAQTIITANQRSARHIRNIYNQKQMQAELKCWASLDILPLEAWLPRCYNALRTKKQSLPFVISSSQSDFIWNEAIEHSFYANSFLLPQGLIKELQNAFRFMIEWEIPWSLLNENTSEETQFFYQASQFYLDKLSEENLIDHAQIINFLMQDFDLIINKLEKNLIFIGFDEFSPLVTKFKKNLIENNFIIQENSFYEISQDREIKSKNSPACEAIVFESNKDETAALSNYIFKIIQERGHLENQLVCIVPNMNERFDEIKLNIEKKFKKPLENIKEINSSYAEPLINFPFIKNILCLLQPLKKFITYNSLRTILLCPWLKGFEGEESLRSIVEINFRHLSRNNFSLEFVYKKINIFCPILNNSLKKVHTNETNYPKKMFLSDCCSIFLDRLENWGFLQEIHITDIEKELLEIFYDAVEELRHLNYFTQKISYEQGLYWLQQILQKKLYQPEKNPMASVHILGILESGGLTFKEAWLMGLDEHQWPLPTLPNAFIPRALQKSKNLPHSHAQREFDYCLKIQNRILHSVEKAILTYSTKRSGLSLQPSPLIQSFINYSDSNFLTCHPFNLENLTNAAQQAELFIFQEEDSPPVQLENEILKGGSKILKNQSLCPFKAFAMHRLGCEEYPKIEVGMDPLEKGTLAHQVLEAAWKELKEQQNLLKMIESNRLENWLEELIQKTINSSLSTLHSASLNQIEKSRLHKLLIKWFNQEAKRRPFKVVSLEEQVEVTLAGLKMRLSLDRMDELEDGSYLLIDYKTGRSSWKNWLGERPDDPQLPLYSICHTRNVSALAFAKLRVDEMKFEGISKNSTDIYSIITWPPNSISAFSENPDLKEIPKDFDDLQQYWNKVLSTLAQQFLQGESQISPKNSGNACNYCELHVLCRIHEADNLIPNPSLILHEANEGEPEAHTS